MRGPFSPSFHVAWAMLIVIFVLCYALLAAAASEVQLGKTKLVGRDVTGLQQEFVGGEPAYHAAMTKANDKG